MATEIEQLFESTTPNRVRDLDVGDLIRRGRARRVRRHAGFAVAAGAIVAAGVYVVGAIDLSSDGTRALDPAGGGTEATDVAPVIAGLIDVTRDLPAEAPRAGHALVAQGVSV